MARNSNKKIKKDNKYNADNEIIIGVTTKPKEKVRAESKKDARTATKPVQKKTTKVSSNVKKKNTVNKQKVQNKNVNNVKNTKTVKVNVKNNTKVNNEIKKQEISKEEKIRKINIKKIIISIVIVILIALGGTIYYLTTPVFNISSIEIYGNEKNSVDTYISLSKINIGTTNIFAVTQGGIKNNIKQNSYVEDVTIKRKLPNILEIHIIERKVAYQTKYSKNYIYLDEQGHILEINEEKKSAPIIDGFLTVKENIQIGQRLLEEDLIKLNVVAKVINYCKYNTIEEKITNIDVTDNKNYIVYFKEDKKIVYLGDASNLSERLSLLKTILKNEEKKEIEIFMNGNLNEDDVYIRYVKNRKE